MEATDCHHKSNPKQDILAGKQKFTLTKQYLFILKTEPFVKLNIICLVISFYVLILRCGKTLIIC